MRSSFVRASDAIAVAGLVCSLGLGAAGFAVAQSPAAPPPAVESQVVTPPQDLARQQQKQQVVQPGNNEPVWREIRSGIPQTTTVRGRETNVLIMPEGETWRALRNGQVSVYGGWALVVVFLAILTFYWIKGPIGLHEPPTGRFVRRFSAWERILHWTNAGAFSILAISGLIILFGKSVLLPLIGYTLFSWLAIVSKNLHNFVGPLFIVTLVLMFVTFVRSNLWRAYDLIWIRKFGGLVTHEHVPSHRFNAGEKAWFWGGILVLGLVVGASGLVLDFPNFNQTRETMQIANIVHLIGATLFMIGSLGHIYMGTVGMKGAYAAMKTGYVDETWAKEHHEYWYNDIKAGRISVPVETHAPRASDRVTGSVRAAGD